MMMIRHSNQWYCHQDFRQPASEWSTGISAGYATDIPPHNLAEVIQATLKYIDNPDITVNQLMKYIKVLIFQLVVLFKVLMVLKADESGKGRIIVRSKVEEETLPMDVNS